MIRRGMSSVHAITSTIYEGGNVVISMLEYSARHLQWQMIPARMYPKVSSSSIIRSASMRTKAVRNYSRVASFEIPVPFPPIGDPQSGL
jgi:hypothetical protein